MFNLWLGVHGRSRNADVFEKTASFAAAWVLFMALDVLFAKKTVRKTSVYTNKSIAIEHVCLRRLVQIVFKFCSLRFNSFDQRSKSSIQFHEYGHASYARVLPQVRSTHNQ